MVKSAQLYAGEYDSWTASFIESKAQEEAKQAGETALFQGFCNALPNRPRVLGLAVDAHLRTVDGKQIAKYHLKTTAESIYLLKMKEGVVLTRNSNIDISTPDRRAQLLETAELCIALEQERFFETLELFPRATAVCAEMIFEASLAEPQHFEARFVPRHLTPEEPDGCSYLARLADQSEWLLFVLESEVLLTSVECSDGIFIKKSRAEFEQAILNFRQRIKSSG